ncbi:hypothetical protein [Sorangium sp. So ce341]|uniref:hypothetical protein n=1 Tax=Sorangium sp. So ce341 TaxID=3133302 RepID=UPI003F637E3D
MTYPNDTDRIRSSSDAHRRHPGRAIALVFGAMVIGYGCFAGPHETSDAEELGEAQQPAAASACTAATYYDRQQDCPGSPSVGVKRCGGRLWYDGLIPYEIDDTDRNGDGLTYSDTGLLFHVVDAFEEWDSSTYGVVDLVRCANDDCAGAGYQKWITVRETASGSTRCLSDQGPGGTLYSLNATRFGNPAGSTSTSWEMLSHEFSHCVGLPHMFWRYDRDTYVDFASSTCGDSEYDDVCLVDAPADGAGNPRRPTGFFGPYDGLSKTNYITGSICEEPSVAFEPDKDLTLSPGDASAAIELYKSLDNWSPFDHTGEEPTGTEPRDYSLANGVTMIGSPAVATSGFPLLHVVARGSDGHIYYRNYSETGWAAWQSLGESPYGGFDSDPAVVSWGYGRIDVVAGASLSGASSCETGADCRIYIRSFDYSGGGWSSSWSWVGYPGSGVKSAPAISSWGTNRLDVFVRGADDKLWQRTYTSSGWGGTWHQRGAETFNGKPAAVSRDTNRIDVVARGTDGQVWQISYNGTWGGWAPIGGTGWLKAGTSPAIASYASNHLIVLGHGLDGLLWENSFTNSSWTGWNVLGGILHGDPAAVGQPSLGRIDVMAPVDDHTKTCSNCNRGIWWKYYPYEHPCYVNGANASCGCSNDGHGSDCYRIADP